MSNAFTSLDNFHQCALQQTTKLQTYAMELQSFQHEEGAQGIYENPTSVSSNLTLLSQREINLVRCIQG